VGGGLRQIIGVLMLILAASPLTAAQEGLPKERIIAALRQKVQATLPPPEVKRIEIDARFALRIGGRPPCSFEGTLVQEGETRTLKTGALPAQCAQFRDEVGTIFGTAAQVSGVFLGNYAHELIGERVIGGDRQYQIRARARDPEENLYLMEIWISWETGLIRDGLLYIRKPKIDPISIVQTFYQEDRRWLLKSVRARTAFIFLLFFRTRVEIDIDITSHRYFL
jgi:hypothetical protein